MSILLEKNKENLKYIFNYKNQYKIGITYGPYIKLPFSYFNYIKHSQNLNQIKLKYEPIEVEFQSELRDYQRNFFEQMKNYLMESNQLSISCLPGYGKTVLAIKLLCELKLKTLIITSNNKMVMKQWIYSIKTFTNTNPNIYNLAMHSDISIVNYRKLKDIPTEYINSFGLIIIDEFHLCVTRKSFNNILLFSPKFLLGLSATPYRDDIIEKSLIKFLFKDYLYPEQNVFPILKIIKTGIEYYSFERKYNYDQKRYELDWTNVINRQSECIERNKIIANTCVDILLKKEDDNILILCKRKKQCDVLKKYILKFLTKKINDEKEIEKYPIEVFYKNMITIKKEFKVLISTFSKIGTGFDSSKINIIMFGVDCVAYYTQYVGRCMRCPNPIVYEFLDENKIFETHLKQKLQKSEIKFIEGN